MKASHKRILNHLDNGRAISTVDAKGRKPTAYQDGLVLFYPRMKTLEEMVEANIIHELNTYVGDGTSVDTEWHKGDGGYVNDVWCPKCQHRGNCPICHKCFNERS